MAPSKKDKLKISVAIYSPREGNYHHWSLHIYDEKHRRHTIYEVVGSHPNFTYNVLNADPRNSNRLVKLIALDRIDRKNKNGLIDAIEEVNIDNETTEWDCQDYVIALLDKLEEECILDEDDEDYQEARTDVMDMYGPIDEED